MYTEIHTPTVVQGEGGLMQPLFRVFEVLQSFETFLPSVEGLWSSQQDVVYFIGDGARRVTSPTMVVIFDFTKD